MVDLDMWVQIHVKHLTILQSFFFGEDWRLVFLQRVDSQVLEIVENLCRVLLFFSVTLEAAILVHLVILDTLIPLMLLFDLGIILCHSLCA